MDKYDVGDVARLTGTFKASDGVTLQDPGTLQFLFMTPAGAITTYTFPASGQIVHDGTGIFHVDVPVTAWGTWRYRWVATGVGQAAEPGSFQASPDPLTDTARVIAREQLRILVAADATPTLDETEISALLEGNKRPDVNGVVASAGASWIPTYDLNAAAADGWLWKAGKCSDKFAFGEDRQQFSREQIFEHCLAMQEQFTRATSGTAKVASMIDDFDPATGFGGPLVQGFFDVPFT